VAGEHLTERGARASTRASWKRFVPILAIGAGIGLFFALGLQRYVSFETLQRHHAALSAFVASHALAASIAFLAVYAAATALSLPGGAVLTIAGGFLFGIVWASLLVVAGATLGAVGVFLAARTALGDSLKRRAGPWMARMEDGFRRDAASYLLVLRLVPVAPFWLVNLVPAFFGVPLRTFVWTTVVGIVPGTVVYTAVGNGLGETLALGETPDLGIIFDPAILLPLIGLAVLALIPVIYRRLRGTRP